MTTLKLLGGQLQKWLRFQGHLNNFYYPETLCKDAIVWRLMLRDIMDDLVSIASISDMTRKTYSSWITENKKQIINIINKHLEAIIGDKLEESASFMRAAHGTALDPINLVSQISETALKVETVHAVKRRTFDAVLLMSSTDARGKTGYWENWLSTCDEAARITYVACSRPRTLLCWGVHTLTDTQIETLEHLGLVRYNNSKA